MAKLWATRKVLLTRLLTCQCPYNSPDVSSIMQTTTGNSQHISCFENLQKWAFHVLVGPYQMAVTRTLLKARSNQSGGNLIIRVPHLITRLPTELRGWLVMNTNRLGYGSLRCREFEISWVKSKKVSCTLKDNLYSRSECKILVKNEYLVLWSFT